MLSSAVHTGLVACSLAMDAFAASCGVGASSRESKVFLGLRLGGACGFFQFIMPLLGWLLGTRFAHHVAAWDHWIAFGLLALVGIHMIREAWEEKKARKDPQALSWLLLLCIGIATAIDAFAVGAGMAFLNEPILPLALAAGVIAALAAFAGVALGRHAGCLAGPWLETAGGAVLILIGLNILRLHFL
ncbi:MAG TPA: manganese efflux pump MntP family protein [Synergistaceae bacterium]|nr:manganese efflux pump MntP family protein [Synergistaceae bacterium]HPJ26363.1 manganese efflux pump MntP family protein [Synergistaceae bacterium]HPQ36648.1 manganese efflux pump MntP family protein [Synergistaceae bacterium]